MKKHNSLEVAIAFIEALNIVITKQEERIAELEAIIFQE